MLFLSSLFLPQCICTCCFLFTSFLANVLGSRLSDLNADINFVAFLRISLDGWSFSSTPSNTLYITMLFFFYWMHLSEIFFFIYFSNSPYWNLNPMGAGTLSVFFMDTFSILKNHLTISKRKGQMNKWIIHES